MQLHNNETNSEAAIFRAAFLAMLEVDDHGARCAPCNVHVLTGMGDFCPTYYALHGAIMGGLELLPQKTQDKIKENALRSMKRHGYRG